MLASPIIEEMEAHRRMAQNNNGTKPSASYQKTTKDKVGHTSGNIGRPNKTAEELRTQAQKTQQERYAEAKEALKQYKDPNSNTSYSINSYDRNVIRGYLQNVGNNEVNLRKAANYLFYRSQIFMRVVTWYASIWDLRCRKVTPKYDLTKNLDSKKMLKSFNDTIDMLEKYKIHENMYEVLVKAYLEDVCYFVFVKDETGCFPYILNADYCRIIGRYSTGDLAYAVDMSKFKSKQQQQFIEWFGEPFTSMQKEYESTGEKYIMMPEEYAGCFKFHIENLNNVIPPLAPLMQSLSGMLDTEDNQAIADKLSIFKLVTYPMQVLQGAKTADDFQITPDLALDYFKRMVDEALPPYVSAAPIPGDGLKVIDFSESSADKDVNRIQNAQDNILNTAGGGAVLSSRNITSTAAFVAWLKSESEFAISALMPQITGFTNRHLSYDVTNPCRVDYFELTILTKEDFREALMKSMEYSYSYRLAYGTLLGFSEKETLATLHFEQDVLGLQNIMTHPLSSSHTLSGSSGDEEVGRPQTPDEELTPSGERTRNQ